MWDSTINEFKYVRIENRDRCNICNRCNLTEDRQKA